MADMGAGWGYGGGERQADTKVATWGQMADHMEVRAMVPVGRRGISGCRNATRQPFGTRFSIGADVIAPAESVPRLRKRIPIERNGRLVNVDNAPTNVPGLERHRVLEVQNSASGRWGLPTAGAGPFRLSVDQEAATPVLLNHQAIGLVDPVSNWRGCGLRPGGLDAHDAQHRACKSQAKRTEGKEPANAFHFLQ